MLLHHNYSLSDYNLTNCNNLQKNRLNLAICLILTIFASLKDYNLNIYVSRNKESRIQEGFENFR